MSILKKLYYGQICPNETHCSKISTYIRLAKQCTQHMDKLMESLDENQKKVLELYHLAEAEREDFVLYDKFSTGFRLGAMLMAESFAGTEE